MNLTTIASANRVTVHALVALISLLGTISFFSLPKQQDPGFTIRAAVVTTRFNGASPERVEQLVTDRIERAIQEMPELDNVASDSMPGLSFVVANFKESYREMQPIFDKLRRKIEAIDDLPKGAGKPVVNDEYGDVFGSVLALTGEGFNYTELGDIANDIKNDLLQYEDIAKVELQGMQDEEIYVEYSISRLEELGISPREFSRLLESINIIQGGGSVKSGSERISLEPTGNFESIDDLRRTVVQISDSESLAHLEDIANIYRDHKDPPTAFARYNGQPAIIISLSLREGGNILELGEALLRELPRIEARYPWGIQLNPVYFESVIVDSSVNRFMSNLLQAVIIVIVIMMIFLGLRTGLIVASLIPATIMMTLMLMNLFSITINQISLAALIISLGLLVDNAIVIAESIVVRREKGADPITAIHAAGSEMAVPLLTSSLTTSAAFLPIFLAESAVGEFTADIFKVVTIALLSSWFLAMTFIPLITIIFMRVREKAGSGEFDSWMYSVYQGLLVRSLRNRTVTLALVGGLFISAIWAVQFVPNVFIPPKTDPVINGALELPRGTSIETTSEIAAGIESFILDNLMVNDHDEEEREGVVRFTSWIGEGAPRYTLALDPGAANPASFSMLLTTTTDQVIPDVIRRINEFSRVQFPDLDVRLRKMENGVPIPFPVAVRISGPELETLYEIADRVRLKMVEIPGIHAVSDDWGPKTKKLVIEIDPERARRAGVTNEDIAISLRSGLSGIELTRLREKDTLIPITMRSVVSDREDIARLEGITIYSHSGNLTVPLNQVARIRVQWQHGILKRRDRDRTITIQASLPPGVTAAEVEREILPWVEQESRNWPRAYRYEAGGEAESSSDATAAIVDKLPYAGMIILLLLVAQFNNVRKPVMILMTIPLGVIGVVYGLLIAQSIFGFFTILGLISLAGIVINNAIVLIGRIDVEIRKNEMSQQDAILHACNQRLRPVLLTTATTVGGMSPLWISQDPMFEAMAVAIMFGLLFATIITLLFIPVMYSAMFRIPYQ